jgi:hypothetical protein
MSTVKEQIVEVISKCRSAALSEREIARKMFLLDPAFVFADDRILGFRILNGIAEKFRISLGCVKISGSSQIGFSAIKNRDFILGQSDLDIAIVSPNMFQRYSEIVYRNTNGYKNLTGFTNTETVERFQGNLQLGYFRPDLMPSCKEKMDWFQFFQTMTDRYSAMFKSINGGIYFSELFFEGKQIDIVAKMTTG